MSQETFNSTSDSETQALGAQVGKELKKGDVVLLVGNLGAGKTVFTKGIVEGVGSDKPVRVKSPTYTIVNEMETAIPIFHLDLYRLESETDLLEIDLEDYLDQEGIVVVEWGDRFELNLPKKPIRVEIEHVGESERKITIERPGN